MISQDALFTESEFQRTEIYLSWGRTYTADVNHELSWVGILTSFQSLMELLFILKFIITLYSLSVSLSLSPLCNTECIYKQKYSMCLNDGQANLIKNTYLVRVLCPHKIENNIWCYSYRTKISIYQDCEVQVEEGIKQ